MTFNTYRVLIVDDDPDVADLAALSLELYNAAGRVHLALSAGDAYQKVMASPYDLVISDLHLGDLDGLALLTRIRADHPGTRLILVTGDISPELEQSAQQLGVDQCIAKPYTGEMLASRVKSLLSEAGGPASIDADPG